MSSLALSFGEVLLSMIWLFFLVIWFWLLISIFADIFRNKEMSGGAKALWVIFVIVLPFLGILIYLIVNGNKMTERQVESAKHAQASQAAYIREVAGSGGGGSHADELAKLAELKDKGVLTDAEFAAQKAKIIG